MKKRIERIVFDVTCLMPEKLSGVGVYTKQLYQALKKKGIPIDPVLKWSRVLKRNYVADHIGDRAKMFFPIVFQKNNHIFHGPDFRLISGSGFYKRLVTIHDIIVFHPGFNSEAFRAQGQEKMNQVMSQDPDGIVVPSQYVANEVAERYPQMKHKIFVIPHGADHFQVREKESVPGNYFLYVGHIEKRKNLDHIIQAFEILATQKPEVQLILVGKGGFGYEEILEQIKASPIKDRIITPGFVKQEELENLYSQALGFVFPSLYEGFGFPILEAMALNTPVITSNLGTMKEVAQGAALLVDPLSPTSIAKAMTSLMDDKGVRQELIQKGRQHVKAFTWEKAAEKYLQAYLASSGD